MTQPALSLNIRRLLKKIEESPAEEAVKLFKELPREPDDTALLESLFVAAARPELTPPLLQYLQRKNLERYKDEARLVVIEWTKNTANQMPTELFTNFCRWYIDCFYSAEALHPANTDLKAVTDRITVMVMADMEKTLAWMESDSTMLDTWVACINDDVAASIGPLVVNRLTEESLKTFLYQIADLEGCYRRRNGELPAKPWMRLLRAIWHTDLPTIEKVTCSFIRGWPSPQDGGSVFPVMLEVMDQAPDEHKTYVKAGLFNFKVLYTQHLAKQSVEPVFDPLICYLTVDKAKPDTTYEATKWAMAFGDTEKFSALVDIVVDGIVKGSSSVLRRFPALFLLADRLTELWENTHDARKDNIAKAVHQLARHWSNHRSQFEKEAEAESQKHYFSSNAELVEKKLGKILTRTQGG